MFAEDRKGGRATDLFAGFNGILQVDGYAGYNGLHPFLSPPCFCIFSKYVLSAFVTHTGGEFIFAISK
jgi:hypothetical protein